MHDHAAVGLPLGFTLLRLLLLGSVTAVAAWALVRPFVPAAPGLPARRAVTGAAALGGIAVLLAARASWMPGPAAVALIALLVLPSVPRGRHPVLGRCVAAGAVLVTAAAGAWFAGPPSSVAYVALMAAFTGLAWLALCPPAADVRLAGAALGLVLLTGLGHVTIAGRLDAPAAGDPLLTRVALRGGPVDVLVVPHMPGWNLVHTGEADLRVGNAPTALVPARRLPAASGRWALVWLPRGRGDLWLDRAGERTTVVVDTGDGAWTGPDVRGPEGPDYASAVLAARLTGARGDVPWPELTDADAAALRAEVAAMGGPFAIASAPTGRAAQAERVVRDEAARLGVEILPAADETLVLAGEVGDGRPAPWLAPPDLSTPDGRRYARALADAFPGERPTASGLAAWTGTFANPQAAEPAPARRVVG
ncbi:DUF6239 family natural product biosynthesis protein [Saccharothrix syringae]|uniref:Uncharacterized protein n=1 Tax=Saccharothrix syringae TaxID=103733 RepID=A0A5Q0H4T3_SACSY|nr:DUF6239 family natural product biosynthesis protein [Saccharothrix syringae]QFZ20742.1 hypothetical protein EKG83_28055 [Saccharothrix syringae]